MARSLLLLFCKRWSPSTAELFEIMMMASRLDSTHGLATPSRSTRMTVLSNLTDAIRGQPASHKIKRGELTAYTHYLDGWKEKDWWWSIHCFSSRIRLQVNRCAVLLIRWIMYSLAFILCIQRPSYWHTWNRRIFTWAVEIESLKDCVKKESRIQCFKLFNGQWSTGRYKERKLTCRCKHRRRESQELEA